MEPRVFRRQSRAEKEQQEQGQGRASTTTKRTRRSNPQRSLPQQLVNRLSVLVCVVHAEIPPGMNWTGTGSSVAQHWVFHQTKDKATVGSDPVRHAGAANATATATAMEHLALNSSMVHTACSTAIEFLQHRNHGDEFSQDHREALGVAYLVRSRSLLAFHQALSLQSPDNDNANDTGDNDNDSGRGSGTAGPGQTPSFFEFKFGSAKSAESQQHSPSPSQRQRAKTIPGAWVPSKLFVEGAPPSYPGTIV